MNKKQKTKKIHFFIEKEWLIQIRWFEKVLIATKVILI